MAFVASLFKAFFIGFLVSAPLGPVAFLIARHTLVHHFLKAFISAFGVVMADSVASYVIIKSLGRVAAVFEGFSLVLFLITGVLMVFVGSYLIKRPQSTLKLASVRSEKQLLSCFVSGFMLTILNPFTWMGLATLFGALGLYQFDHRVYRVFIVMALALGAFCWWLFFIATLCWIRKKTQQRFLDQVERLMGFCILGVGVYTLVWKVLLFNVK